MTLGEMVDRAYPFSKGGRLRLINTAYACTDCKVRGIPGDFVECGVWRGGNAMMARWARPDITLWLYDTFDGMTEPGPHDTKRDGERAIDRYNAKKKGGTKWAAADVIEVFGNLLDVGAIAHEYDNVNFIEGDVRKTLLDERNVPDAIAVLRLDTDWYDSTKIELEVLYPRLVSGGILIVDDYGHWMGARKATDEYLGKKARHLRKVDYSAYWMVKP